MAAGSQVQSGQAAGWEQACGLDERLGVRGRSSPGWGAELPR